MDGSEDSSRVRDTADQPSFDGIGPTKWRQISEHTVPEQCLIIGIFKLTAAASHKECQLFRTLWGWPTIWDEAWPACTDQAATPGSTKHRISVRETFFQVATTIRNEPKHSTLSRRGLD
jgi:hypothetical protein